MGLGAMMAGGNPASGRQENDWYPTPPEVTKALLREHLSLFMDGVFDPAAGDGAILDVAKGKGLKVWGSDIAPRRDDIQQQDFFELKELPCPNIVTNPPFNLADQFIRHAFDIGVERMALVLKSTYYHAKSRKPLFDEFKPNFIRPLLWRPDFLGKGRPTMEVSWIIWGHKDNNCIYKPLSK